MWLFRPNRSNCRQVVVGGSSDIEVLPGGAFQWFTRAVDVYQPMRDGDLDTVEEVVSSLDELTCWVSTQVTDGEGGVVRNVDDIDGRQADNAALVPREAS